jgi:hypothetical protein
LGRYKNEQDAKDAYIKTFKEWWGFCPSQNTKEK